VLWTFLALELSVTLQQHGIEQQAAVAQNCALVTLDAWVPTNILLQHYFHVIVFQDSPGLIQWMMFDRKAVTDALTGACITFEHSI
jgi:hypothetical protein